MTIPENGAVKPPAHKPTRSILATIASIAAMIIGLGLLVLDHFSDHGNACHGSPCSNYGILTVAGVLVFALAGMIAAGKKR